MNICRLLDIVEKALHSPCEELVAFSSPYYSPYYSLMRYLAEEIGGGISVELGVESGRGIKSLLIPGWIVYGVDVYPTPRALMLEETSNGSFIYLKTAAHPVPGEIPYGIDLLHIDTQHSYATAETEFTAYEPRLSNEAVVLFDDTHAMEDDVQRYVDTLLYPTVHSDELHSCGYAVVMYTRTKQ